MNKSASILPFNRRPLHPLNVASCPATPGALKVEIPDALAKRISDAAIWERRTVPEFVLAMLNAAFPDQAGAA